MFVRNGEALGSVQHTEPKAPAEKPEQTPVEEPVEEPEVSEVPAHSALKADWVDFAVECGAARDEAEALTKADLIDLYGGED